MLCVADFSWTKHEALGHSKWKNPILRLSHWPSRGSLQSKPKQGAARYVHQQQSGQATPGITYACCAGESWLHWRGSMTEAPRWSEQACKEAASLGLIHVLEKQSHLKAVSIHWGQSIWKAAAAAGQVDVLCWGWQQAPAHSINLRRCLIVAAGNGQDESCKWICKNKPRWYDSCDAMEEAAENGRWATVRLLHGLQLHSAKHCNCCWPTQPGPFYLHYGLGAAIAAAAAQGKLNVIQWVCALHPTTYSLQGAVIARAAANGNYDIIRWLLVEQRPAPKEVLEKIFAVAIAHQNYSTLSLMASLGLQVAQPAAPQPESTSPEQLSCHTGSSLQQLAMCLTPARKGHPLWQMVFKEALQASPWAKPPPRNANSSQPRFTLPADDGASQRYTHLLHWLRDLAKPKKHARGRMQGLVEGCHSIVPIQLAAQGLTPRLPWTPFMHRLAGAHADLPTLGWMLKRKQKPDLDVVVDGCPPARMLMLVKQHGWSLPVHLVSEFTAAEIAAEQSRRFAILSVVQQQRTRLPEQTCFGSLPNEILSIIAQKAGYNLPSPPSACGYAVGALQTAFQLRTC